MATVASYEALNNLGELKFQEGAAMVADPGAPIPASIFNPSDGTLLSTLKTTNGLVSVGGIDPAGVTMPRNITNDETLLWQSSEVSRSDISRDSGSVSFTAQESYNTATLALKQGYLLAAMPSPGTLSVFSKPPRANQPNRRLLILGHDLSQDIIVGYYYPQAKVTAFGDEVMTGTAITQQMFTFDTYIDPVANTARITFIGGPGWLALAHGGPAASLAVTPTTATLSAASHATSQLAVTATYPDASTATVTSSATYTSSNSAVASVSVSGLITAQAVGSLATITATYQNQYAVTTVTVTT